MQQEQIDQPTRKSFFRRFWPTSPRLRWLVSIGAVVVLAVGLVLFLSRNKDNGGDPYYRVLQQQEKEMYERELAEKDKKPTEDSGGGKQKEFVWPSVTAKYISAVPVDLTQIQKISKYRSCAGHDRSGYSFDQVLETNRSMKHYLYPVAAFQGTTDKVKMFAPFDGTVSEVFMHDGLAGKRPKNGNGINFTNSTDPNVLFGFGHIYFAKDFKVGDQIKTGELIGYAALGDKGFDFDIDLMALEYYGMGDSSKEVLGSIFDHMTPSVLAEFAKYGITPANIILTKEARDAKPCNYSTQTPSNPSNDFVTLTE